MEGSDQTKRHRTDEPTEVPIHHPLFDLIAQKRYEEAIDILRGGASPIQREGSVFLHALRCGAWSVADYLADHYPPLLEVNDSLLAALISDYPSEEQLAWFRTTLERCAIPNPSLSQRFLERLVRKAPLIYLQIMVNCDRMSWLPRKFALVAALQRDCHRIEAFEMINKHFGSLVAYAKIFMTKVLERKMRLTGSEISWLKKNCIGAHGRHPSVVFCSLPKLVNEYWTSRTARTISDPIGILSEWPVPFANNETFEVSASVWSDEATRNLFWALERCFHSSIDLKDFMDPALAPLFETIHAEHSLWRAPICADLSQAEFFESIHANPFLRLRMQPHPMRDQPWWSEYARWTPEKHRRGWWGPYFHQRVKALLLICLRHDIPAEVRVIIVARLAEREYV
jgi:hypothetical protein